jgi:hypothetical protein
MSVIFMPAFHRTRTSGQHPAMLTDAAALVVPSDSSHTENPQNCVSEKYLFCRVSWTGAYRVKPPCTGGGAGIAACCDIRIGTAATRIGFPIARTVGNCLSMCSISRLVSLIGPARTKDLIFKARLVDSPAALALGLLNEVVPDVETLQRRVDETAKLVAGHAPITLEVTKERCAVSGGC